MSVNLYSTWILTAVEQQKPEIRSIPKKINSQWKGDFLLRTTFTLAVKLKKSTQQKMIPDSNHNLAAHETVN